MVVSKTSDHIQIKIKMPNPSQDPPASSNAPNEDFEDMEVLCTVKIKMASQNLDHGCIKDQLLYTNQDQNAKSQSETSSVFQSPKSGLKRTWMFFAPSKKDRDPKFGSWVYQRPVTISKSRSRCLTLFRNL